jgi:hypothetical protein
MKPIHTILIKVLAPLGALICTACQANTEHQVTSHGIIWELSHPVESGTFLTGDPWVIGPVDVVGISNTINSPKFTPRAGQNGSMLNPLKGATPQNRQQQGYDDGIPTYNSLVNAGRPNGQPVSPKNPLALKVGSSLISSVSWLYLNNDNKEADCPRIGGTTGSPRPTMRAASILTVLQTPPPANSFRPIYCGEGKTVRFTLQEVNWELLKNFPPPYNSPNPDSLIKAIKRPWVDHAFEWMGGLVHPSEHMPNYGRDMGNIIVDASLLLHTNIPSEKKRELAVYLIQYGIDLAGIADNGGGWRANGGHSLGRKWPILFAGIMLNDEHMSNAGHWPREFDTGVEFQEDQQHFYITQEEVHLTQSTQWSPDKRSVKSGEVIAYTAENIGTPEWGIRYAYRPSSMNGHWWAKYREVNGGVTPGFALAALIMDARDKWNHEAFFDYQDRYVNHPDSQRRGTNAVNPFVQAMWDQHRSNYPPAWIGQP